jgi:hypothetical protein
MTAPRSTCPDCATELQPIQLMDHRGGSPRGHSPMRRPMQRGAASGEISLLWER